MAKKKSYDAMYPFNGDALQNQISFPAGAQLSVPLEQPHGSEGWWWGSYLGRKGWFPSSYVTPVDSRQDPFPSSTAYASPPVNVSGTSRLSTPREAVSNPVTTTAAQQEQQQQQGRRDSTKTTAHQQQNTRQARKIHPSVQVQNTPVESNNIHHSFPKTVSAAAGGVHFQTGSGKQQFIHSSIETSTNNRSSFVPTSISPSSRKTRKDDGTFANSTFSEGDPASVQLMGSTPLSAAHHDAYGNAVPPLPPKQISPEEEYGIMGGHISVEQETSLRAVMVDDNVGGKYTYVFGHETSNVGIKSSKENTVGSRLKKMFKKK